jgi:hypothetical protein
VRLETLAARLLASGGPREGGTHLALVGRIRLVVLPIAFRQPDERLEGRGVRLRVVDL